MKRSIALYIILILSSAIFAQVGVDSTSTSTTQPSTLTGVAAIVNGVVITTEKLDFEAQIPYTLAQLRKINERMYMTMISTREGYDFLRAYRRAILNELIDGILISQYAQKVGIVVTDDEVKDFVNKYLDQILKQYNISEKDLEKFLKSQGYKNIEQYKERLFEKRKMILYLSRLKDKVTANVTVTDEEIRNFYEKNKDKFKSEGSVHVRHILLNTEEEAKEVLEGLKAGEKFEDLAREKSVDEFSKIKGGDLGWVEKGSMDPAFEKAVFSAKVGDIVGPVKTAYGWHIIEILEKKEGGSKSLDEVRKQIESYLLTIKKEQEWQRWLSNEYKKFRESASIEIYI